MSLSRLLASALKERSQARKLLASGRFDNFEQDEREVLTFYDEQFNGLKGFVSQLPKEVTASDYDEYRKTKLGNYFAEYMELTQNDDDIKKTIQYLNAYGDVIQNVFAFVSLSEDVSDSLSVEESVEQFKQKSAERDRLFGELKPISMQTEFKRNIDRIAYMLEYKCRKMLVDLEPDIKKFFDDIEASMKEQDKILVLYDAEMNLQSDLDDDVRLFEQLAWDPYRSALPSGSMKFESVNHANIDDEIDTRQFETTLQQAFDAWNILTMLVQLKEDIDANIKNLKQMQARSIEEKQNELRSLLRQFDYSIADLEKEIEGVSQKQWFIDFGKSELLQQRLAELKEISIDERIKSTEDDNDAVAGNDDDNDISKAETLSVRIATARNRVSRLNDFVERELPRILQEARQAQQAEVVNGLVREAEEVRKNVNQLNFEADLTPSDEFNRKKLMDDFVADFDNRPSREKKIIRGAGETDEDAMIRSYMRWLKKLKAGEHELKELSRKIMIATKNKDDLRLEKDRLVVEFSRILIPDNYHTALRREITAFTKLSDTFDDLLDDAEGVQESIRLMRDLIDVLNFKIRMSRNWVDEIRVLEWKLNTDVIHLRKRILDLNSDIEAELGGAQPIRRPKRGRRSQPVEPTQQALKSKGKLPKLDDMVNSFKQVTGTQENVKRETLSELNFQLKSIAREIPNSNSLPEKILKTTEQMFLLAIDAFKRRQELASIRESFEPLIPVVKSAEKAFEDFKDKLEPLIFEWGEQLAELQRKLDRKKKLFTENTSSVAGQLLELIEKRTQHQDQKTSIDELIDGVSHTYEQISAITLENYSDILSDISDDKRLLVTNLSQPVNDLRDRLLVLEQPITNLLQIDTLNAALATIERDIATFVDTEDIKTAAREALLKKYELKMPAAEELLGKTNADFNAQKAQLRSQVDGFTQQVLSARPSDTVQQPDEQVLLDKVERYAQIVDLGKDDQEMKALYETKLQEIATTFDDMQGFAPELDSLRVTWDEVSNFAHLKRIKDVQMPQMIEQIEKYALQRKDQQQKSENAVKEFALLLADFDSKIKESNEKIRDLKFRIARVREDVAKQKPRWARVTLLNFDILARRFDAGVLPSPPDVRTLENFANYTALTMNAEREEVLGQLGEFEAILTGGKLFRRDPGRVDVEKEFLVLERTWREEMTLFHETVFAELSKQVAEVLQFDKRISERVPAIRQNFESSVVAVSSVLDAASLTNSVSRQWNDEILRRYRESKNQLNRKTRILDFEETAEKTFALIEEINELVREYKVQVDAGTRNLDLSRKYLGKVDVYNAIEAEKQAQDNYRYMLSARDALQTMEISRKKDKLRRLERIFLKMHNAIIELRRFRQDLQAGALKVERNRQERLEAERNHRVREEAFEALPEDWKDIWKLWKSYQLTCTNGHRYFEKSNVGNWFCWQHAGVLNIDTWECCGRDKTDFGCVPADHRPSERKYTSRQTIANVPQLILDHLGPRPGISGSSISRFDEHEHDMRKSVSRKRPATEYYVLPEKVTFLEPFYQEIRLEPDGTFDLTGLQSHFWNRGPVKRLENKYPHTHLKPFWNMETGHLAMARFVTKEIFHQNGEDYVTSRMSPSEELRPVPVRQLYRT